MPLYPKALPEKYYLDHFNEIVGFVLQHCQHLLAPAHQDFLDIYQHLAEDTQCILVRVINRKSRFIQIDKMDYQEIADCPKQLAILAQQGLLRTLSLNELTSWLAELTKPQLLALVSEYALVGVKKSAAKALVLEQVLAASATNSFLDSKLAEQFYVKNFEPVLAYLLYLFFGNSSSKLDKFSMRDLGVLKTRDKSGQPSARFDSKEQAYCCFYYSDKINQLKRNETSLFELAEQSEQITQHPIAPANSDYAQQLKDEYFYLLGKQLLTIQPDLGMQYLQASKSASGQEKWLRELYKQGAKEQVKQHLEQIIEQSLDERLLLFAEDFYQRKYHQVKLSKLTATLRQDSYSLAIDEIHKDQVEKGVKQYYQNKELRVYRTENRLFNALFGLTFWPELFEHADNATATEFDRRPKVVKQNSIYQELGELIEQRLLIFEHKSKVIAHLTKMATIHFGQPNGMFRWHPKMLQILTEFLQLAPAPAVVAHLRAMAKNFSGLNDGYPDLLLIDDQQIRFVEVKAPGDAIRANQFVTINALQQAGFNVQLCRVQWSVDPKQAYVVVDVETTGGKQPYHRITEIGAVKIINGEVVDKWSSLINPQRSISKFITQLTGIDNQMVSNAPLFSEIADNLLHFMHNAVFVAHNVNFDYGFFKMEFARLERNFDMPKLCTVKECRKYFKGLESYSLSNLCQYFDIPLTSHHRALCDAEAAGELLKLVQQQKLTG